ncbi:hypothetical protein [Sulfurimonas sp.]|uniref:hypothetical protein n=1 Tax=Sulfurimonas sp. TaxID=2022749 RepID=UPI0025D3A2B6|nr:hypothetical protein [Sulfurimonas sp.]MDD5157768.1 hypothetical protein [Sulfurimonas sp.]
MAGVHFTFDNFKQLLDLTVGLAQRLDENRSESFTLLYCDFSTISKEVIDGSLDSVLRNSDSVVNCESNYFFILPYTDKYGAEVVKKMFEEFSAREVNGFSMSYPADGEDSRAVVEKLRQSVKSNYKIDLKCLEIPFR